MRLVDKLYVPLSPETLDALHRLAERNLRTQREQAAFLIIEGLNRHGRRAPCADAPKRGVGHGRG